MLLSCRKRLVALLISVTLFMLAAFLLPARQWWESLRLIPHTEEEREEERRGFEKHGFNQFLSDRLPLNRPVPDTRDPR